ncbi:hypothetical protein JKP88DRAFT_297767 [Tribonema minus]|uniref:MYND-type domain-containing protein n=1 Tax=Tribonema minus TaxID=303371 RepID=A0A835ZGG4_9STRA|nr:hypothetical protein JKP88DRAFT_297767 [Tribonema minus]
MVQEVVERLSPSVIPSTPAQIMVFTSMATKMTAACVAEEKRHARHTSHLAMRINRHFDERWRIEHDRNIIADVLAELEERRLRRELCGETTDLNLARQLQEATPLASDLLVQAQHNRRRLLSLLISHRAYTMRVLQRYHWLTREFLVHARCLITARPCAAARLCGGAAAATQRVRALLAVAALEAASADMAPWVARNMEQQLLQDEAAASGKLSRKAGLRRSRMVAERGSASASIGGGAHGSSSTTGGGTGTPDDGSRGGRLQESSAGVDAVAEAGQATRSAKPDVHGSSGGDTRVRRSRTKWCAACSTCATSARPLKKCGRCHAVEYCSSECQLAHWRQAHKHACQLMAAQRIAKQTT